MKIGRMMIATLNQHLESTPEVRAGRVRLAGTRISVDDVVVTYIRGRKSVEEIVASYDLSPAAVHAALSYYYENKAEIDRLIANDAYSADLVCSANTSLLREKLDAADHG